MASDREIPLVRDDRPSAVVIVVETDGRVKTFTECLGVCFFEEDDDAPERYSIEYGDGTYIDTYYTQYYECIAVRVDQVFVVCPRAVDHITEPRMESFYLITKDRVLEEYTDIHDVRIECVMSSGFGPNKRHLTIGETTALCHAGSPEIVLTDGHLDLYSWDLRDVVYTQVNSARRLHFVTVLNRRSRG